MEELLTFTNQYGLFVGVVLFLLLLSIAFIWREWWPHYKERKAKQDELAQKRFELEEEKQEREKAERRREWESHLTSLNQQRHDFAEMLDKQRQSTEKRDTAFLESLAGIHNQIEANTKALTQLLDKDKKKNER